MRALRMLRRGVSYVPALAGLAFTLLLAVQTARHGEWLMFTVALVLSVLLVRSLVQRLLSIDLSVRDAVRGAVPALAGLVFTVYLVVQAARDGAWTIFAVALVLSVLLVLSLARRLLRTHRLTLGAIEGGIAVAGVAALLCFCVFGAIVGLLEDRAPAAAAFGLIAAVSGYLLHLAARAVRIGFARPSSNL